MREVDRLMVEAYGVSLLQMMELAGHALAHLVRMHLGGAVAGKSVVVAAGQGNNGGGGQVAVRHLSNWGAAVTVLVESAERIPEVPHRQWETLAHLPVGRKEGARALEVFDRARADLIVDALIGYGLRGHPRGWTAEAITCVNAQRAPVIALDVPSGLDATTGEPARPCINATATITLALPKTGLLTPSARPHVGALYLADIGVPPALLARLQLDVGAIFSRRSLVRLDSQGRVIPDGK
ncbi:MAG: NAD(P)H-hydrate epimerase [Armatimonadetes bacterium 13_1_40CM_64_14]|nr:MAG: NAD(P)H-hydrate epimerase [Armatimonadetes bacterium 13_1_40CM_64_14]